MATARRMKAPLEQPVEKGLEPGALGLVSTTVIVTASADPDCGTTFTWATRALGPRSGWAGGWAIIVADVLVMASLAQVAGQYVFFLFNADGIGANPASGLGAARRRAVDRGDDLRRLPGHRAVRQLPEGVCRADISRP